MTEAYYDIRIDSIIDRSLNYAGMMATLRTQKDPGCHWMENEYRMLLNILDSLSDYTFATTELTTVEVRFLFELLTDILMNDMRGIPPCTFTGSNEVGLFTEGLVQYRKGIRNGLYVIDKSIDGGITWDLGLVSMPLDETSYIQTIDAGIPGWRQEVRGGYFCIDMELTPTGFSGTENIDWTNVYNMI